MVDRTIDDLPQRVRDVLAVIGGLPLEGVSADVLAVATGEKVVDIEGPLNVLAGAGLLRPVGTGQLRITAWATAYAHSKTPITPTNQAWQSVVAWYLERTCAASQLLAPHRRPYGTSRAVRTPYEHADLADDDEQSVFADRADAVTWLLQQWSNLVTLIRGASAAGQHPVTVTLAQAVLPIWHRARVPNAVEVYRLALTSARILGDPRVIADMLTALCQTTREHGDVSTSLACVRELLNLRASLGDERDIAGAWLEDAQSLLASGAPEQAVGSAQHATAIAAAAGDQRCVHLGLVVTAHAFLAAGQTDAAISHAEQALNAITPVTADVEQPRTLYLLACVYERAGRMADAENRLTEALTVINTASVPKLTADIHRHLAQILRDREAHDLAAEHDRHADNLYARLGLETGSPGATG